MSSKKTASKEVEKGSRDEDPSSSSSISSMETPTRESSLTTSIQSTGLSSFIPKRTRSANSKEQTSSGQKSQEETGTTSPSTGSNNASGAQATGTGTGTGSTSSQSNNASDDQETETANDSAGSNETLSANEYSVTIGEKEYTVIKTKDGITVKDSSGTEINEISDATKFVIARLGEKKKL